MPGFGDKLMGLLSDPRTMDIGMGLLSAGGPSFTPHNLGQDMASAYQYANGREGERAQLEMQRMQLNQQKKQQAARAQIGQIYANRKTPQQIGQMVMGQMGIQGSGPGMLNPQTQAQYVRANQGLNAINNQRQQQLPGLLSEAYPEQYGAAQIKGLFGTPAEPKTSTAFNDWIASGGDPSDREGFQKFSNPIDLHREAQLTALMADMAEDVDRRRREDAERMNETQIISAGVESGITDMVKLFDINNNLENTMLQSGLPFEEWRKAAAGGKELVADFFGLDKSNIEKLNEDHDLFRKISKDFALNSMDRLSGTGSNFQLQSNMDANAGLSTAPGANRYVIAGNLEELLLQARVRNIQIPEATRRAAQEIIDSVNPPAGFTERVK